MHKKYIYPEELAGKNFRIDQLQNYIDKLEKALSDERSEKAQLINLFLRAQAEHDK
jgi:hypothetical protein